MIAEAVRTPSRPNPVIAIPSEVMTRAKLTTGPRRPTLVCHMAKALAGITSPLRGDNWEELKLKSSERNRKWNGGSIDYATDRIEKIRSEEGCFGCRIFDIRLYGRSNRKNPNRRRVLHMSNIRHSTLRPIESKNPIRRRVLRMSNIRHSTMRPIESKKSDPTNKANRIEFATFDPTECTRLDQTDSKWIKGYARINIPNIRLLTNH